MPNLLPGSVLDFQLEWVPAAGRLIWSIFFATVGLLWVMVLMKKPAVKNPKSGPGILVIGVGAGASMVLAGKTIFDGSLTGDTLIPFGFMIAWLALIAGIWVIIMSLHFSQLKLPTARTLFYSGSVVALIGLYVIGGTLGKTYSPVSVVTTWLILCAILALMTVYLWEMPPRINDATWAETVFGAMFVFVMMTFIYALIPHEWITFATSYLNFTKDVKVSTGGEFILQTWLNGQIWSDTTRLIPFEINLEIIQDHGTIALYVIAAWINIKLFAVWQKRNVPLEVKTKEEDSAEEKKTSRFGRPIKTLKTSKA